MTYTDLAKSRLTPKFRGKPNFNKVLDYIGGIFDDKTPYIDLLKNLKNIESDETYILDELGKLLGVYPRPFVQITAAESDFFAYDLNGYDQYPYVSSSTSVRRLNNDEYRKYLKASALLINFDGTIPQWERVVSALAGGSIVDIINGASSFTIGIRASLTVSESIVLETFLNKINNLTVNIDDVAFAYYVTDDSGNYIVDDSGNYVVTYG